MQGEEAGGKKREKKKKDRVKVGVHCRIIPSKSSCKVHNCFSGTESIVSFVHVKR